MLMDISIYEIPKWNINNMTEFNSLIKHMTEFFTEESNSFQILEKYFFNFCAIYNVTIIDMTYF